MTRLPGVVGGDATDARTAESGTAGTAAAGTAAGTAAAAARTAAAEATAGTAAAAAGTAAGTAAAAARTAAAEATAAEATDPTTTDPATARSRSAAAEAADTATTDPTTADSGAVSSSASDATTADAATVEAGTAHAGTAHAGTAHAGTAHAGTAGVGTTGAAAGSAAAGVDRGRRRGPRSVGIGGRHHGWMRASAFVVPRSVHPLAWWLWALGLATAASRTTNPVLLLLLAAAAGCVVAARRTDAPWARAYTTFVMLGLVVIAIRVVLQAAFGAEVAGRVLFVLPSVALPDWMAGVRLGGPVTLEGLAGSAYQGLRLAVLLCCVGAANALANPFRLLRCLPGALYEVGVAVVVAMSFSTQAVTSVGRVRAARRLRGRPDRGVRGVRGLAMPVLEGALERSVALAASMDSRGYGRRAGVSAAARRLTAGLVLAGLLGLAAGSYGLLDPTADSRLGLPVLAAGTALAVGGLALGGRRTLRSRYRPDPWALPEWLTAAAGVLTGSTFVLAGELYPAALVPSTAPLLIPAVPMLAVAGALVALLPAVATPQPPAMVRPRPPAVTP
jgi:energy-coupling factor transport system permease protein